MPRKQSRAAIIAGVFIITTISGVCSALGGNAAFDARDALKKDTIELGIAAGFDQATTAIGNAPSADRSAVFAIPRLGIVLTDPVASGWWQGNIEFVVQPVFARFTRPFAAEAAGGSFLLAYNFLSFGRWVPFVDAGAGMIWTNLAPRIPEQSTQFEFTLEAGLGVHYFLSERMTWTMGVRLHHISNGGLGDRNTGINGVLPYMGISFFTPTWF